MKNSTVRSLLSRPMVRENYLRAEEGRVLPQIA